MSIVTQIEKDYLESYKAHDEQRTAVLRLLKSSLKNTAIDKKRDLTEEESIAIVQREIKQRRESITEYQKGGREELATAEQAEINILSTYLPAQLSEDELKTIITKAIADLGANDRSQSGRVIGTVMAQVKGKTDGTTVARLVNEALSQ